MSVISLFVQHWQLKKIIAYVVVPAVTCLVFLPSVSMANPVNTAALQKLLDNPKLITSYPESSAEKKEWGSNTYVRYAKVTTPVLPGGKCMRDLFVIEGNIDRIHINCFGMVSAGLKDNLQQVRNNIANALNLSKFKEHGSVPTSDIYRNFDNKTLLIVNSRSPDTINITFGFIADAREHLNTKK